MKKYFKKLKEWLVIWIWFLIAFSIWTFAYSKIEIVKSGDVLSADSYNQLINKVNDLEFQLDWNKQKAYDTTEVWTWEYDVSWKKIYSVWFHYGLVTWVWAQTKAHWIKWIDKIIKWEYFLFNELKELMLTRHLFTTTIRLTDIYIYILLRVG